MKSIGCDFYDYIRKIFKNFLIISRRWRMGLMVFFKTLIYKKSKSLAVFLDSMSI